MTMATGSRLPTTATSGIRESLLDGLRIMTGTGPGSIPGAGLGWTMRAGDMRPSTTVVGPFSVDGGDGFPGRVKSAPFMRPLWSHSLAADSPPARPSRGSHWLHAKSTFLHIV